jgi:hypothetical protein
MLNFQNNPLRTNSYLKVANEEDTNPYREAV